jgi:hypothetical protein
MRTACSFLLGLIPITALNQDFKDLFQRNFLSILCNTESNYGPLWWHKYVLYCWLLPATTFSIVFAALIKQSVYNSRFSLTYMFDEKILIVSKQRWNIYFTSYILKIIIFLQRVRIFRVQPGILEVGLVKNTREFGEL